MIEKKIISNNLFRILAYLLVIIGVLLIIIPFLWMILTSLKEPSQVFKLPIEIFPNPFSIEGYSRVFQIWDVPRYFKNTIIVSLSITVGSVFICTLAGYSFAKIKFPWKKFWFYYIIASLMLPLQVRMIPTFLLLKQFGWLNTYQGLIVPWLATGFLVFLMRQMATAIPNDLIDAARVDGCSEFRIFWTIAIPNLKSGMYAIGIITLVTVWNDLLWPLIVISKEQNKTLPLLLSSAVGGVTQDGSMPWPTSLAAAAIVMVPVFIVYIFFQKYIIRAMAIHSGIKD